MQNVIETLKIVSRKLNLNPKVSAKSQVWNNIQATKEDYVKSFELYYKKYKRGKRLSKFKI